MLEFIWLISCKDLGVMNKLVLQYKRAALSLLGCKFTCLTHVLLSKVCGSEVLDVFFPKLLYTDDYDVVRVRTIACVIAKK